MTSAELWVAVGERLQRARLGRKWRPIQVERAGGPSYKTVQAIEAGDAGTVESLDKYARALDLSLVDILQSVLAATITPLTPEAAQVVRKFAATTVAGRTALLAMANALPIEATLAPPPPLADGAGRRRPRPPQPGPRGAGPRSEK